MPLRSTHPPQLEHIRVRDCMHPGIHTCEADASLSEVAGIMVKHRVHAVAVTTAGVPRPIGVVSDLDVVAAAAAGEEVIARHAAATEPLAISANAPLDRAAQLMTEHGVSHLVVIDSAGGYPVGIVSTLDIAVVIAGHCEP
ncbi:MAG: CBS domain-containing protein [Solirubrobacteraceae bacterium]